jgi:ABC-2 type transport system ATP-binding protein
MTSNTMTSNTMTPLLELRHLTKSFGKFAAVQDVSLQVARGQIFAFLGVNGAGKTTSIRLITGILEPSAGEILIDGISLANEPERAKQQIGYVPDRPYLYPKLTAREYIEFVAALYHVEASEARQRAEQLLGEYSLLEKKDALIESLSHGMKQRVATCAALVHQPPLLIVDEPTVGLDPHGARTLKRKLISYREQGMSVFLSTHSLSIAQELADVIGIIHNGKLLCIGSFEYIQHHFGKAGSSLEELFIALTTPDESPCNLS